MLNEDGEPRGEEMTSQETQQLLQELNMKDEQLNELKLERCSLEKKVCDLADRLAEQTHAHEATVAMERAEVNKVTNENQVLANELHVLRQSASEMSSKLETLQTELSTQTKIANELSEELDAAKTLIKGHQAEYCSQSKSTESLMMEADNLRQELSARQLSHDKIQAECERMVELSHKKSRRINDLEQEVSQTRAKMCQLEELCSRLKYEHDAQDKLIQTLSKQNQHEELQNIVRLIVESEIFEVRDKAKRKITAMEKDLAHKDTELETKAQELSKVSELVDDGQNKIQTLSYDLQQVQRERADVKDQLCEANIQKEQLEKQILILSEENKMFQQRLCEANELRDQAGHSLSCTEQFIDPQQTVKSNHVTEEESLQPFQTTCQDLLAEQKLIEETCGNLNKCTQTDEEELLEARLNETKSITEDLAQLQEMYQKPNVGVSVEPQEDEERACRPAENRKPNEEQADDTQEKELDGAAKGKVAQATRQLEGDQQDSLQLELEILKQKLDEKQDTTVKLQREKDDLAVSCKAVTQKVDRPKQTSKVALLDNSILSTKSLREESFTKTGLKFTITPLKPDQMKVRKPGEEKPVRKRLRSTARKRKSPELESSVESENRKTRRLKVNNRENIQFIETPVGQGEKVTRLKQKDSVSMKGKKDRALKKIGDFIQNSPTIFGSKAKKIISMVNVRSPELLNPSEKNPPKISKRKLFKFSSPLDIPSHSIIGSSDDDQDSSHFIIKRKLRTRTAKSKCKH